MAVRQIIKINEDLCDGCGLCVPSCAEGAIKIIDGKAKLVKDQLCDGLGACLGECPNDALRIEEREAAEFDEAAVEKHLYEMHDHSGGCPSARPLELRRELKNSSGDTSSSTTSAESTLSHWPVKLQLVPPGAPFLRDAHLLLAADCVPFSTAQFHSELLPNHAVVIGCPKFDDYNAGVQRLAAILRDSGVRSLTVAHMEVPCCFGYWKMAEDALAASGRDIPLEQVIVGIRGDIRRPSKDDMVLPRMTAQRPGL